MDNIINKKEDPKILIDFLMYMNNVKNYSKNTIKEYRLDLKTFFNFIIIYKGLNLSLKDITIFILSQISQSDIISFLLYINYNNNNCSSTRSRKIASIKTFYKWLLKNNPSIKKENPTNGLPMPEGHLRLPKCLTLEEAKKIQEIFNKNNCREYIRNNCIITLFLSTGLRISELININIEDIDFNDKSIIIIGKGNKERTVFFSEYCKKKLQDYINTRSIENSNEPLFISSHRKRISKSSIEFICRNAYILMGLGEKGYTVHTLRHTTATIMYKYSKDILCVKEFLGHSSIASTEIYLHTHNENLKIAMEKHPLNIE